jgi:hypothetical protein
VFVVRLDRGRAELVNAGAVAAKQSKRWTNAMPLRMAAKEFRQQATS